MKHHFIINPAAGKGKCVATIIEKIKSACSALGIEPDIYYTKSVGDGTDYVGRAVSASDSSEHRFYACGGDGTLCEVVNGVMKLERRDGISVGVVPSGTGNDFVRNFTDTDRFFDISAQLSATTMKSDIIACNDMYAVNMVNIGFDCEVVCKKEDMQKNKIIPSKLAYIVGLVVTLIRKPGVKAHISYDGEPEIEKDMLLMTYANGEFCGGGFHSNPLARINNGRIDALAVNDLSRTKFVSIVGSYKKGTHLKYTNLLANRKAERVDIRFIGPTNVSVDGEIVVFENLSLRAVKDAIDFLVPDGCEYIRAKENAYEEVSVPV